ncbi:GNAT family N-acetyltransferase [Dechloromonas sp. XY25]|uniref:GNAT family N-acetyltransferase n=1 Tax=Dechloromonas hankyongensis TaxID=2908002 RepID=A0ABS9K3P7_9RHOO|nr:GNAT family N-acetyltransferase [Dechloromonas hankyongensis]MCG2577761.1 GNAT family N-acetyltransferase [Dechloromonas hankyongensis]
MDVGNAGTSPKTPEMNAHVWQSLSLNNQLGEHGVAWDACNQRLFRGHLLFDSRFVGNLLKHFGQGNERLMQQKNAAGELEMCLLRPAAWGRWETFFPSQAQISPVMVGSRESLGSIFDALSGIPLQIDFLGQDITYSNVVDGLAPRNQAISHTTTISIDLSGTFEEYWNSRPKNLAKNIRRYKNRLAQGDCGAILVQIDTPGEMAAAVTRYGQLEADSWKGLEGTAVLPDNLQGRFYTDVLTDFARTGNAIVYELWINERLAASRLVILDDRMFIILKTAYNKEMAQFAPGRLLLYEVIADAYRRIPGGILEFYTNATADQHDWATHSRTIVHQTIYRNGALSIVRQLAKLAYRSAVVDEQDHAERDVARFEYPSIDLPEAVVALFSSAEKHAFDLGQPWFANLAATVSVDGYTPTCYVGSVDGRPRAALPMLLPDSHGGKSAKGFETYYTTLFQPVLIEGARVRDLRQIIDRLRTDCPALSELRFAPLNPSDPASIILRNALQAAGWVTFGYFCFGNWYLPVKGNYQDYFESRKPKMRNTIRRLGKKLIADGGALEVIVASDRLEDGIAAYNAVYSASWKVAEPHEAFVPGLVRMLAATGRLRLGVAWLGGKPIAAQIWVVNHGKAGIYKVGYDEAHAAYSPGTLLTAHLMEHVIDRDGVSEVDYYIGDDPYKQTWMTHRRERWGIVAYNPKTLYGLWRLTREVGARVIKSLANRFRSKTPEGAVA